MDDAVGRYSSGNSVEFEYCCAESFFRPFVSVRVAGLPRMANEAANCRLESVATAEEFCVVDITFG